ncbi:HAMP domain-containing protein [Clostridiaceae bacterium]|jgi:methyl-accepting chemotaxis protein|nr:HAMP domain-containing protein [Clostridium sp.]NBI70224.1 HAMP domain-containing protein [Clostridiaceae bacterium]
MEKSIKKAIWMRVAIIFFVVIVSGASTVTYLRKIRRINKETVEATNIHTMALSAEKAHYSWIENLSSAISYGTEFTGSTDCTTCVLGKWLYNTDRTTIRNPRILSLMDEIIPIHEAIHTSATEILELNQRDHEQAKEMYLNVVKKNVTDLVTLLEEVVEANNAQVHAHEDELGKAITVTLIAALITIVVTLISCCALLRYVFSNIVRPISVITEDSQRLSRGELDFEIQVSNQDEIGVLAKSLNDAAKTLAMYITDISDNLNAISKGDLISESNISYIGDFVAIENSIGTIRRQLNDTMAQIHLVAVQVGNGAESVASGAQSLAQGATEQANEIDNLVKTINLVSGQIKSNADYANQASDQADQVERHMEQCNGQMRDMSQAMDEISGCSNEIGHIIKTIEDIAFQTNILALNAAVEAARAGSAGKGFAVVADEVRNLAAKSAEAAKSTSDLIEKTLGAVSNGVQLTESTQEAMGNVVKSSQAVIERVHQISDASAQQSGSVSGISEGISQIASVVQNNSATSEASAAASEELSSQVQVLRNLLEQFKLKESAGY